MERLRLFRVLGLDGAYMLGWEEKQPVLVAVDLGTRDSLTAGYINDYNPQAVTRWFETFGTATWDQCHCRR